MATTSTCLLVESQSPEKKKAQEYERSSVHVMVNYLKSAITNEMSL